MIKLVRGARFMESGCWFLLGASLTVITSSPAGGQIAAVRGSECGCTGDANGDSRVTVDELVGAVNNALDGCPLLLWYRGCGPPVPGRQTCPPSVEFCTMQQVGAACSEPGASCCQPGSKCLGAGCNKPLVCTTEPRERCPISRRRYKRDVEYLARSDLERLRDQLLAIKLASFRYAGEAPSAAPRLGFVIEDVEPSPSVDRTHDAVDLYGYVSMAVATVQVQGSEIRSLQREIEGLRQQVNRLERGSSSHRSSRAAHAE